MVLRLLFSKPVSPADYLAGEVPATSTDRWVVEDERRQESSKEKRLGKEKKRKKMETGEIKKWFAAISAHCF